MSRKSRILCSLLFPLLLISTIFIYVEKVEKSKYERYISEKLSHQMHTLSISIIRSNRILGEIIEKQSITDDEADNLSYAYSNIRHFYQEVGQLGVHLEIENTNNYTANMAQDFGVYIRQIKQKNLAINHEVLRTLQIMKKINNQWENIINKNVKGITETRMDNKYWHDYAERGVELRYWSDVLKELSKYANEVSKEYGTISVTSLENNN